MMKNLKTRLLTGWSLIRFAYLVMGIFISYQAFIQVQWIGGIFGLYFVSMAIFGFGCASGACYSNPASLANNRHSHPSISTEANNTTVTFEEVTHSTSPTASK